MNTSPLYRETEPATWLEGNRAVDEMARVQTALEERRLFGVEGELGPLAAGVVRSFRLRNLPGVLAGCAAMIEAVGRMPVGRYQWRRAAKPSS